MSFSRYSVIHSLIASRYHLLPALLGVLPQLAYLSDEIVPTPTTQVHTPSFFILLFCFNFPRGVIQSISKKIVLLSCVSTTLLQVPWGIYFDFIIHQYTPTAKDGAWYIESVEWVNESHYYYSQKWATQMQAYSSQGLVIKPRDKKFPYKFFSPRRFRCIPGPRRILYPMEPYYIFGHRMIIAF